MFGNFPRIEISFFRPMIQISIARKCRWLLSIVVERYFTVFMYVPTIDFVDFRTRYTNVFSVFFKCSNILTKSKNYNLSGQQIIG